MSSEQIRSVTHAADKCGDTAHGCKLRVSQRWLGLCAALLFCASSPAEEIDYAAEPPVVTALLREAMSLERFTGDRDKMRRVVMLYCEASRYGSLEAQYRFGLLYLSGKGVPQNVAFATTLFSQAAQQGYARAVDALEHIRMRPLALPPCLS